MSNQISANWSVKLSKNAEKQYKKLKINGSKPSIIDVFNLLVLDIKLAGPYRSNWSNYGTLENGEFHCHLKRGRPTFVACWKVIDKKNKIIEVYYVGTHENAPY